MRADDLGAEGPQTGSVPGAGPDSLAPAVGQPQASPLTGAITQGGWSLTAQPPISQIPPGVPISGPPTVIRSRSVAPPEASPRAGHPVGDKLVASPGPSALAPAAPAAPPAAPAAPPAAPAGPAAPGGPATPAAPARPAGRRPPAKKPATPARPAAKRPRVTPKKAVITLVLTGLLGYLLVTASTPDPSVEPTVQAFLLAWEEGHYHEAATYTTGAPDAVTSQLRTAYRQLGAADITLQMGHITQHGDVGEAHFHAAIDLGRSVAPWRYEGVFTLRRIHSTWKVMWSPSVINPALKPGYRLAVVTTTPRRAPLLDAAGRPLAKRTRVFVAGVLPTSLKSPYRTAAALAAVTGLDVNEVYGDILAAPSKQFFELARFTPHAYHRLRHQLRHVPGLQIKRAMLRLFDSTASSVVGRVGTETATVLRNNGVSYQPGATVGLSGLQQAFQRTLVGTPSTSVVAENATGRQITVLARWSGHPGQPVRTTIDSGVQDAATQAVKSLHGSAALVAIDPSTGRILAVATHQGRRMPEVSPLNGAYRPGQAFSLVSTAALISDGFNVNTRIPCMRTSDVGGRTFTNHPMLRGFGPEPAFSTDFAAGCSTAFATLSLRLTSAQLTSAAKSFGLGAHWQLPVPASAGPAPVPASVPQLAADTMGQGRVALSPLQMALMAGLVQSGSLHRPVLVTNPPSPGPGPNRPFSSTVLTSLRSLMRQTVTSGAARSANVPGQAVFGQVGNVSLGPHHNGLHAVWFVGYRGGVAFAVLELTKSAHSSAAPVARSFLQNLPTTS
jgi:cell division protein FtsI/penicillin-binding protein 2